MKMVFALLLFVAAPSFAAQVCTDIPATMKADISNNFDGSINATNIKLLVDNEFVSVMAYNGNSAVGICRLLKKTYTIDWQNKAMAADEKWVHISHDAKLVSKGQGPVDSESDVIDSVICR